MKNENLFQKNEYSFLVESTKIENVVFPYKNAVSKANRITDRMGSTEWTKGWSFADNYFIFLKILLQFKNVL